MSRVPFCASIMIPACHSRGIPRRPDCLPECAPRAVLGERACRIAHPSVRAEGGGRSIMTARARRGVMGASGIPARTLSRRRRASLAALLAVAAMAWPVTAGAARPQRTVFLSQPSDWAPQVDDDHKPPSLSFQAAWTWSGFKSPLAGDPLACAGSIVAASRDGEIAALEPIKGEARWVAALAEPLIQGPASDGTRLFVATSRGRLHALNGSDGASLWTTDLPAEPVVAPRVLGARVLIGTADGSLLSIEKD